MPAYYRNVGFFVGWPAEPLLLKVKDGGEDWIRTNVHLRDQIYSLTPLTTRPPLLIPAPKRTELVKYPVRKTYLLKSLFFNKKHSEYGTAML